MKLRGRSILEEVNDSTPKRAKCRDPDSFEEIYPDAITSYGKYGKCHGSECDGVPAETTEIEGKRFCRACASKDHDDRQIEGKKFVKSDAEFKCPAFSKAESCKSKKISFEDFYLGSCCEEGSKWLTTNEKAKKKKLQVIKKLYAQAKQEQRKAKLESEEKKNEIKNMQNLQSQRKIRTKEIFKTILETDKEIEATKKGKEDTEEKLREAEEDFDIVAKRFKQISYEYHSVASEKDIEANENPGYGTCQQCMGKYGDDRPRNKCVIQPCGHVLCRRCLDEAINESECYNRGHCPRCDCHFYRGEIITIYE